LQFFGPRDEANPRNPVRLSTAPKETASSGRNNREKSDRSKKHRSTPEPKADNDQANARAHYTSVTEFGNFIQRDEHRREIIRSLRRWTEDGTLEQKAGISSVSSAAHLGGAAVGILAWLVWRKPKDEPRMLE
jgi:hypothetical protein